MTQVATSQEPWLFKSLKSLSPYKNVLINLVQVALILLPFSGTKEAAKRKTSEDH